MQLRGRRAIAIAACAWLVLAGLLGLRHEADVAHVVDGRGAFVHAVRAIGHRAARAEHLHERAAGDRGDDCSLAAALRQPGVTRAAIALVPARSVPRALAAPAARATTIAAAIYRLAPKTSPPRA